MAYKIVNSGTDTSDHKYSNLVGNYIYGEIESKRNITKELKQLIVLNHNNTHLKLSSGKQFVECVNDANKIMNEKGEISRIDLATDFKGLKLNEDYKLIRLLMAVCKSNTKARMIYKVIKDINKLGNIKFKITKDNITLEVTFYDCQDKDRVADSRMEVRVFNGSDKVWISPNKALEQVISIINELHFNINDAMEVVENWYIDQFKKMWREDEVKENNKSLNFNEFVATYRHDFLTKYILEELYNSLGRRTSFENWFKNFNSKRKYLFTDKKDLEKLSESINKSVKKSMKNIVKNMGKIKEK